MTVKRILTEPFAAMTWRRTGYALAALPLSTLWFTLVVTGISLGVGLLITLAGIPVLWLTLWMCQGASAFERGWMRAAIGRDVAAPPRRPPASDRWYAPMVARLLDPQSWRDAAGLTLSFVTGVLAFTVAVTVWATALGMIAAPLWLPFSDTTDATVWGTRVDGWWSWVATPVAGALLLLAAPWIVRGAVALHAGLLGALLGPTRRSLEIEAARLSDSRARSVDAAAAERRRIERDLHDGAQARLVTLAMDLGRAKEKLATGADQDEVATLVADAHDEAKRALVELRDLARGIHSAVLTDRGLDAAISALAARCPVPVDVTVDVAERPSATVEAVAYFVVAEALTNVAKHAEATSASVLVRRRGQALAVEIGDDGRGGADAGIGGGGLAGLAERVQSVDGTLTVTSPDGGPTRVLAVLPCV